MELMPKHELKEIIQHFQLKGKFLDAYLYGSGHIHDTYASRFKTRRGIVRYIHQQINHKVFREPEKVMENIERVTRCAREKIIEAGGDPLRETLNLIPAVDGKSFYKTPEGNYWRTYVFIEGARTFDKVENVKHIYNAAKAFGNFQKMLSCLPGGRLHETIPNFHHTRKRYEAFLETVAKDVKNRARHVKAEIDFVLKQESNVSIIVDMLEQGKIPERVTHNDTKLNNVMIDDKTGEGICVIDLDTVMPGSALYDFGDAIRIGACTAAEDEQDLLKVGVDMAMFDCLAHGYLDAARDFLTPAEMDRLAFSAILLTFECGVRFLTDYLAGDVYFKIHREGHNLDRCRTQFKMVSEMEQKMEQMVAIVNRYR